MKGTQSIPAESIQYPLISRLLFMITALMAAYQIMIGIEGMNNLAIVSFTVAFGVILVACLLVVILGFEILESPPVVIIATVLPLSFSFGLVAQFLPSWLSVYSIFTLLATVVVALSRYFLPKRLALLTLAIIHAISGILIFTIPIVLSIEEILPAQFSLVGFGGALMGLVGLLLYFLKMGMPIVPKQKIMTIFPIILLLMTLAFIAGLLSAK